MLCRCTGYLQDRRGGDGCRRCERGQTLCGCASRGSMGSAVGACPIGAPASSARACRASTAGPRSRAPICSAPTPRRPTRCGCAWCARRMRGRTLHARRSRRRRRAHARARRDPHGEGRAGRERLRHLPAPEGPAGARARRRALSRRGGAGARRHARGGRGLSDAELPIAWSAAAGRCPASTPRSRDGRAACTRTRPTTC